MSGELLVDAALELGGHRRGHRGDAGREAIARTRIGGDVRGRDEQPALALEDRRIELPVGAERFCSGGTGEHEPRRSRYEHRYRQCDVQDGSATKVP